MKVKAAQEANTFMSNLLYNLPPGVCSWLFKGALNLALSFTNLLEWGKMVTDTCQLCKTQCGTSGTSSIAVLLHWIVTDTPGVTKVFYTWFDRFSKKFARKASGRLGLISIQWLRLALRDHTAETLPCASRPWSGFDQSRIIPVTLLLELTNPYDTNNGLNNTEGRKQDRHSSPVDDFENKECNVLYPRIADGTIEMVRKRVTTAITQTIRTVPTPQKNDANLSYNLYESLNEISGHCSYVAFKNRSFLDWKLPVQIVYIKSPRLSCIGNLSVWFDDAWLDHSYL